MPYDIIPLPAFTDNYIWVIVSQNSRYAAIVDPGDADVVVSAAKQYHFKPCCILVTHHHWDHTGGVQHLKEKYAIPAYGPDNPGLDYIDYRVKHSEQINLVDLSLAFDVMETPGHTLDHIVYKNISWLFCGDTLFSAGCGRLFEGSAEQLYQSLCLLAALPHNTAVYCTHEYTLDNLRFALTVEPDNPEIQKYFDEIQKKRMSTPLLPSLLVHPHWQKSSYREHTGQLFAF